MKRLTGIVLLLLATTALGTWEVETVDGGSYDGAPAVFLDADSSSPDRMYIGVVAQNGLVRLFHYDSGAGSWVSIEGDVSSSSSNQVPITVCRGEGETQPALATSDFDGTTYGINYYRWSSSWGRSLQTAPPYGEVYSLSSVKGTSSGLIVMASHLDDDGFTGHYVHTCDTTWNTPYRVEGDDDDASPEYSRLLYDELNGSYYFALYTIDGELFIEDDQFGTGWGSPRTTVVSSGVTSQFDAAIVHDGTNWYIYVIYFDSGDSRMKVVYANVSTIPPYTWTVLPQIPMLDGGTHLNIAPAIDLCLDNSNVILPHVAFAGDQTGTTMGCYARYLPDLDEWMPEFFNTGTTTMDTGYLDMLLDLTGHPYVAFITNTGDTDLQSSKQLNFAPDPFNLLAPADNTVIASSTVAFDWKDVDDYENDTINYTLELSTDIDFNTWDDNYTGTNSQLTHSNLPDSDYYWRVKADDGTQTNYNRDGVWHLRVGADDTPAADTAVAFDVNTQGGIQGGDYVNIVFSEPLNSSYIPTAAQLDAALPLSNGHTWLDGSGNSDIISLFETNVPNDTLMIVLSTSGGVPTVAPGDTIDLENSSGLLRDADDNSVGGQVIISGSFGPGDVPLFDTSWSFIDTLNHGGVNTITCRIDPASSADVVNVLVAHGGYENFDSFSMTYSSNGVWSWDVDATYLDLSGILYAFSATNSDGTAIYPSDYPSTALAARLAFTNLTLPLVLPAGNDVTDYRLVSMPVLLDNPDANAQFADDFGGVDSTRWRLFHWDPLEETYYEYGTDSPDYLAPGGGFWLITKNGCSEVSIYNGQGQVPNEEFTIPMYAGWNLIGNPFAYDIDWASCNTSGLDVETPITYGDSGYEPNQTVIQPGGGYWLWSNEEGDLIIPPIAASGPPTASRPPVATAELTPFRATEAALPELTSQVRSLETPAAGSIGRESLESATSGSAWGDAEQWQLAFILSDGVSSDTSHRLGVSKSASDQYDSLERHDPPGLGGLCNLWFENDWSTRSGSYCTDLRKPFADGASWSFYATAPANATLSWSQENGWQEGFAAMLETPAGRRIDLLAENSISLTAAELASQLPFRVFIGDEDYLDGHFAAREVSLSQSYPNPTTGLARIEFSLTEAAPVELAVYDLAGRRVALLSEGTCTAGRHAVGWDASEAAPGVYLYHLKVDGETVATKRLVVTR